MVRPARGAIVNWTTDTPTKPGRYWWRHNSHVEPDILKIAILGEKFVVHNGEDVLDTPPGEWAGPLVRPA